MCILYHTNTTKMNKIKKVGIVICSLLIIFVNIGTNCFADIAWWVNKNYKWDINTNLCENCETTVMPWWEWTFLNKISWLITIPKSDDYTTNLWYAMALIKITVNRLLWILATIALIYLLYCGFLIFSSGSWDSGTKKGKAWIKTAIIALAWISLSWLIVSFMIRFIERVGNIQ